MDDLTWLRMAALAAEKAQPEKTFENPRVGAVIVKNGQAIAIGWHEYFGGAHAEINAYRQLKRAEDAVGATLYVTLEPCAVHGKVGSCAEAMSHWGLARVVIGDLDPNQSTHGFGVQKLRSAGMLVDVIHTTDSQRLNPAFYQFHTHRMPYVQLKLAQSHNGMVTAAPGVQSKITDAVADRDVHLQRAAASAMLIGSETWLIDQPRLNVRGITLTHQQPLRVVIDRRGRLQNHPSLRSSNWLVYTENEVFAQTDNVVLMADGLTGVMADLWQRGIKSLMVEGGPTLMQSFLDLHLWHECLIYTSDTPLTGGVAGLTLTQSPDNLQRVGNTLRKQYFNQEVAPCLLASHKPLVK